MRNSSLLPRCRISDALAMVQKSKLHPLQRKPKVSIFGFSASRSIMSHVPNLLNS